MRPNQTPCGYLLWHLYASGEGCLGRCLVSQNRRKERGASLRLRGLWIPAAHAEPRRRLGTLGLAAPMEIRRSERTSKESDERPPGRELARPKAVLIDQWLTLAMGQSQRQLTRLPVTVTSCGAQARTPNVPIAVTGSDRFSLSNRLLTRTDLTPSSLLFPVHIPPCTHSFAFTRVKTPISSCVKLSALPSTPIVNVVRVGACVAPGNCMTNAPLFQCFNVAGCFAGLHSTLSPSPSSKISPRP